MAMESRWVLLSTEPVRPKRKILTQRPPTGAGAERGGAGEGALASEQIGTGERRLAGCRAEGRDKSHAEPHHGYRSRNEK